MKKGIVGRKVGMTQIFDEQGHAIPVTVIEAGPCYVIQKKTVDTDGYNAIQVGFKPKKAHRVNRPLMGHYRKAGKGAFYHLKELRIDDVDQYEVGQEIRADIFQEGELVDVTGYSKGRGFQGVVKRWGFAGGPSSHGSMFHRAPGSIGQCSFPGRVWKGLKMAGRMGNERVTVLNLKVVKVIPEKNLILVKGAVPGARNGVVILRDAVKKKAKN
ncbi:MAG: 50S ribosomal protein L3 [Deltaproteobacteria bacterium]|nr:MAG: 50S ribosomal protein L3 [Deltaproteobacteria bacterium]